MEKKIDLILLLIYPVVGAIISHLLMVNAFASVIIFFGIPSIYLTVRAKRYAKKSIIFSLVVSVPLIIVIDHIAQLTGQWVIPYSMFPRIFQYVSVEVILWGILNLYFVIMFYEYFLHHHFSKKLWFPQMRYLVASFLLLFILFASTYSFYPLFLKIPFFYFWFGIVLIAVPIALEFYKYPKFIPKFLETAAYFFYLTLTYEITALQLGWWGFPGTQFIGWVSIFGTKLPIEELVFWLILFAMAILTYYEYFDYGEK